jgi:S1-C subfamily serine protease
MALGGCSAPLAAMHSGAATPAPLSAADGDAVKRRDTDALEKKVYELVVNPDSVGTGDGRSAQGSAVMVRCGDRVYCVTAAHLVERDVDSIVAKDYGSQPFRCSLLKAVYDLDVAVLAVAEPEKILADTIVELISPRPVTEGQDVVACGYADERRWCFPARAGQRTLSVKVKDGGRVYHNEVDLSSALLEGCSGGPVFDAAGLLLGICSCGSGAGSGNPPAFFPAPGSLLWLLENL